MPPGEVRDPTLPPFRPCKTVWWEPTAGAGAGAQAGGAGQEESLAGLVRHAGDLPPLETTAALGTVSPL